MTGGGLLSNISMTEDGEEVEADTDDGPNTMPVY